MGEGQSASLSAQLQQRIRADIAGNGGWLPFDRFMALALYEPGLGYYANGGRKFGAMPDSGSDFVTAPEMSPLFGRALAVQVAQALQACQSGEIWEFGAGSGALAAQLLAELGDRVDAYHVVELSAELRERQALRLQPWAGRVNWHDRLPERMDGVLLGNEVLDAMPVQLLHWDGQQLVRARCRRGRRGLRVAGPADAAAATRRAFRARHGDRDPPPGRSLRAHAGQPHGPGGGLLHRLWLPRGRVLPPAAHRRHVDVPSRAPGRRRPAGGRRAQGHHLACQLQRHRAGRAGCRPGGAGLHLAGALPDQLRACGG